MESIYNTSVLYPAFWQRPIIRTGARPFRLIVAEGVGGAYPKESEPLLKLRKVLSGTLGNPQMPHETLDVPDLDSIVVL